MEVTANVNQVSQSPSTMATQQGAPAVVTTEAVFLSILTTLGIVGNTLLILSIIKEPTLRKKIGNLFILNLAASDILVTVIVVPVLLANVIAGHNIAGDDTSACTFMGFIMVFSCGLSIYSLVSIAFNRLIFICANASYKRIFTKRNSGLMIGGIWVFSATSSMMPFFGWGRFYYDAAEDLCAFDRSYRSHAHFILTIGVIIPSFLIMAMYGRIFFEIRRSTEQLRNQGHISQGNNKIRKAIRTLFIVFIFFECFWAPFGMSIVADPYDIWPVQLHRYTAWLGLSNSCVNSFVYGLRSKQFRVAYKNVLCFWKTNKVSPRGIPQTPVPKVFHVRLDNN